ncbi:hypothetical protein G7Y89_g4696 [Cudoniella acicularis]|uniref:Agmatinase n=1 Tax=Cudoniella acicularis TaxID=354080 RepID=A0A8H4W419_9HELO|nr:hypothetical protein G7Y89_g4696 [Cudoniella acicularis]
MAISIVLPLVALALSAPAFALHGSAYQKDLISDGKKWDFEWGYSGINTFGHLPHIKCLTNQNTAFDMAVIGVPFDTAVSFRPGARFGPRAIRSASARHLPSRGFNTYAGINPYMDWAKIIDCGDVPVTPFDNDLALKQMTEALTEVGSMPSNPGNPDPPKLLILGGDHSIALPALRALNKVHGQPMAVVHFDAHLDTLHPHSYPSQWSSEQTEYTHGSMFYQAYAAGLVKQNSSIHVGLRTRLTGVDFKDYQHDDTQGYIRLSTEDIDEMGPQGIADAILARVGADTPVYLSIDIDVIDPSICPGTGAPETGGWTMREMNKILRGLREINVVGADIVEVSPAYDDKGEGTGYAAAQIAYEIMTSWVVRGKKTFKKEQADIKTEL